MSSIALIRRVSKKLGELKVFDLESYEKNVIRMLTALKERFIQMRRVGWRRSVISKYWSNIIELFVKFVPMWVEVVVRKWTFNILSTHNRLILLTNIQKFRLRWVMNWSLDTVSLRTIVIYTTNWKLSHWFTLKVSDVCTYIAEILSTDRSINLYLYWTGSFLHF